MKQFFEFLKTRPQLKLSYILGFIFLCLIPGRNYYYQLDLSQVNPVVRPVDYPVNSVSAYPVNINHQSPPSLSSRAAVVIDVDSKTIIFSKNPDVKLLPASLTKIMTALVALENYSLNEVVTVGKIETEPYTMALVPGEKITVANLLYGLLVASANDAAIALAEFYPQGESGFVEAMNHKAEQLHLSQTHFTNVIGFDRQDHYTTVHDLSLLAGQAMTHPVFKEIVSTAEISVTDVSGETEHQLENLNELLGEIPGLTGVKTGRTELAGECLITYTQRETHALITVVLGSSDRFEDSRQLIDWSFTNHRWLEQPPATHQ